MASNLKGTSLTIGNTTLTEADIILLKNRANSYVTTSEVLIDNDEIAGITPDDQGVLTYVLPWGTFYDYVPNLISLNINLNNISNFNTLNVYSTETSGLWAMREVSKGDVSRYNIKTQFYVTNSELEQDGGIFIPNTYSELYYKHLFSATLNNKSINTTLYILYFSMSDNLFIQ